MEGGGLRQGQLNIGMMIEKDAEGREPERIAGMKAKQAKCVC